MGSKEPGKDTVLMQTDVLRVRLNRVYKALRGNALEHNLAGRFEYLWDLKELATMAGQSTVSLPLTWLEELEEACPCENDAYKDNSYRKAS